MFDQQTKKYIIALFFILLLVLVNYGNVHLRGAYADDFVYLGYLNAHSLWDVVIEWGQTVNSRYSQGLLYSLLFTGFDVIDVAGSGWTAFHAMALTIFLGSVVLFERILSLLNVSRVARLMACLLVVLHPIKNQAILWPSTIITYVIPFFLVLLAIWIYFYLGKHNRHSWIFYFFIFAILCVSVTAIEQVVPILFFILLLRFMVFPDTNTKPLAHLMGLIVIYAIFISTVILGRTLDRVERHSIEGLEAISGNLLEGGIALTKSLLLYPVSFVVDKFYWPGLTGIIGLAFFIALLLIIGVLAITIDSYKTSSMMTEFRWSWAFFAAVLLIIPLAPLVVVDYSFPERVFYIPLFGFALIVGLVIDMILMRLKKRLLSVTLFTLGVMVSGIFVVVNLMHQIQFSEQWQFSQALIKNLHEDSKAMSDGDNISVFNYPIHHGPVPNFNDHYTIEGMINWLQPSLSVNASSMVNIRQVLPELTLDGRNRNWNYLRTGKGHIVRVFTQMSDSHDGENKSSAKAFEGRTVLVDVSNCTNEGSCISVDYISVEELLNVGILALKIMPGDQTPKRLIVHITYLDGRHFPYDQTITSRNGYFLKDSIYRRDIIIDKIKEVSGIDISLEFEGVNDGMSGKPSAEQRVRLSEAVQDIFIRVF